VLKFNIYDFRCLAIGEKGMWLESTTAPATVFDYEPLLTTEMLLVFWEGKGKDKS